MPHSPFKGKKWIIAVLIVVCAIVLAGAALLILGGRGLSARYDDAAALLSEYDGSQTPARSVRDDGSVALRLTREDLYWYARRYGLLDDIRADLSRLGIDSAGFRLSDGKLTVYALYKTWGFLPLSYRASVALSWDNGLVLQTEKLSFGNHLTIPRSRWPEVFSRPYVIPVLSVSPRVKDAYPEGDALILVHEGLASSLDGSLRPDAGLLHTMALYGVGCGDELVESFVRSRSDVEIPGREIRALLSADERENAFAELLSLCDRDSVRRLFENTDPLTADMLRDPLLREVENLVSEREAVLTAEQSKYEKLLSAVRESYKSGGLSVSETGFVSVSTGQPLDPASLTQLSATATDCRVVFLYGSLGGGEFCSRDMPFFSAVPRTGKKVMEGLLSPDTAYDLGVALPSESGVPLLLYRRADDTFVLREIGEERFVSLLVERETPVLDTDLLAPPSGTIERNAGEGWSGAVILTAPEVPPAPAS